MNKAVAMFLLEKGWSQSQVARLFKVTRARINQIASGCKPLKPSGDCCQICSVPVQGSQYIEMGVEDELRSFLVCTDCKNGLKEIMSG